MQSNTRLGTPLDFGLYWRPQGRGSYCISSFEGMLTLPFPYFFATSFDFRTLSWCLDTKRVAPFMVLGLSLSSSLILLGLLTLTTHNHTRLCAVHCTGCLLAFVFIVQEHENSRLGPTADLMAMMEDPGHGGLQQGGDYNELQEGKGFEGEPCGWRSQEARAMVGGANHHV